MFWPWLLGFGCTGGEPAVESDVDGDGYAAPVDCDDGDPGIHPNQLEICDDRDENCNGRVDENASDAPAWYADVDGDGYGVAATTGNACHPPHGTSPFGTDCDDADPTENPGALELCGGDDEDCDGVVDEDDALDALTWYADLDGDGFGDAFSPFTACDEPHGFLADATDCDDTDPNTNPDAWEVCGGADENCDGAIDEDDAYDAPLWYPDTDGDGYGEGRVWGSSACTAPDGYVDNPLDCDDALPDTHPDGVELCGGDDEDCDGAVDEYTAADAPSWFSDRDGDGYGDATSSMRSCTLPAGHVADSTDCDDTTDTVSPAAPEVCGGGDEDCDGVVDEDGAEAMTAWYADADGDGYGAGVPEEHCAAPAGTVADDTDCDDSTVSISPGAVETCRNGIDDDCDGRGCDYPTASLSTAGDVVIDGTLGGGELAQAGLLAGVGDTDGDGYPEIVAFHVGTGAALLFDGATLAAGGTLTITDNSGSVTPALGYAYPGAGGDLDGDGRADLVVGMGPQSNDSTALDEIGVFLGPFTSAVPDMTIQGEAHDDRDQAPAVVGDVDGDGIEDLVVGAYGYDAYAGRAYLVSGPPAATMSLADADAIYTGDAPSGRAGYRVAPAGDTDADGYADVLIGAPYVSGTSGQGAVYLVLGPSGVDIGLSLADAVIAPEMSYARIGSSFAAGDADGDGFSDLLLVTNEMNSAGYPSAARFAYGPFSGAVSLRSSAYALEGDASDGVGRSVAMSDVDANGTDDLLFTTEWGTHLFLSAPTDHMPLTNADASLAGGKYVVDPGDVNGDGYGDMMWGEPGAGAANQGAIYLLFGTGI